MICIKEEPEEEEEVMATLLLDCKLEQGHHAQTEVRLPGNSFPDRTHLLSRYVMIQHIQPPNDATV